MSKYQTKWVLFFTDFRDASSAARAKFERTLANDGWMRLHADRTPQCVWSRHFADASQSVAAVEKWRAQLPEYSDLRVLSVTDAQFAAHQHFFAPTRPANGVAARRAGNEPKIRIRI